MAVYEDKRKLNYSVSGKQWNWYFFQGKSRDREGDKARNHGKRQEYQEMVKGVSFFLSLFPSIHLSLFFLSFFLSPHLLSLLPSMLSPALFLKKVII